MHKEDFARFVDEPTREGLRALLKGNSGEQNNLDFKFDWPEGSKLAKHILALANYGGGCIVIGVEEIEDTLTPNGLKEIIDKTKIVKKIDKFLPGILLANDVVELYDFSYEESEYNKIKGKKFQILVVSNLPKRVPFVSPNDGQSIKKNRIYTRRGMGTVEASYEEIQSILNRRIETGYSSTKEMELETHLTQLKTLYGEISRFHTFYPKSPLAEIGTKISQGLLGDAVKQKNNFYPEEDYEAFISKIIRKKKKRIELDINTFDLE
ncbi:helix-turn-helix domain-containing protein [Aquibacillus albus]|uniref:Schlafen AlbA-2 domain-containing protein n=1 Tax=Aquibacillus albus TaxID=1168171 RepID=A0ABS2N390_9BACI|nr:ATP-binding protein [Aquibacillus albus]MBM7572566.1 hypothetical protein [Aquibacillus albus]